MEKIAQFTGETYSLAIYKDKRGYTVRKGTSHKRFKNELCATEWCDGYVKAHEKADFFLVMPKQMLYLKPYINKLAKGMGTSPNDIIIHAINMLYKNKYNSI